jgi:multidrug transporter EmrE-like cation transporter
MGYTFLILTIIVETTSVCFMKLADGYNNKGYFVLGATFYVSSFLLLNQALKYLPMGWTNAMWAGSSTVLVAILGIALFNETLNSKQVFFMVLIIIGLVGLELGKDS